jgi:hypothetical protein
MAVTKELIARFKGDTTGLRSAVNRASSTLRNYEKTTAKTSRANNKFNQTVKGTSGPASKTASQVDKLKDSMRQAASSIAVVDGPLGGVASRFNALGTTLGRVDPKLVGVTASLIGLAAALRSGIRNFTVFEQLTFRLNAALDATGRSSEVSSGKLESFAESLGIETLTSRAEALRTLAQTLTFENIRTQDLERIVSLAQDITAIFGGSLQRNASLLARTLDDPTQSLTRLQRVGVTFTETERDKIKALAESGKLLQAQSLILDKFANVQGAAKEEARGLAGATDSLGEAWSNSTSNLAQLTGATSAFQFGAETLTTVITGLNQGANELAFNWGFLTDRIAASSVALQKYLGLTSVSTDAINKELAEREKLTQRVGELVRKGVDYTDAVRQAKEEMAGLADRSSKVNIPRPPRATQEQFKAAEKAISGVLNPLENYRNKIEAINQLVESGALWDAAQQEGLTVQEARARLLTDAWEEYTDAVKASNKEQVRFKNQIADSLASAGTSFDSFRDTAVNALQDVLKNMLRLSIGGSAGSGLGGTIAKSIFGAFGGTGVAGFSGISAASTRTTGQLTAAAGSGAFAPGLNSGGNIQVSGNAGIDRNALSINGQQVARVSRGENINVSNGGSGVTINQNLNFSTGIQQTVRAEILRLLPAIENQTTSAVEDAKRRGKM